MYDLTLGFLDEDSVIWDHDVTYLNETNGLSYNLRISSDRIKLSDGKHISDSNSDFIKTETKEYAEYTFLKDKQPPQTNKIFDIWETEFRDYKQDLLSIVAVMNYYEKVLEKYSNEFIII